MQSLPRHGILTCFRSRRVRTVRLRALITFASVLAAVLLYGGARLALLHARMSVFRALKLGVSLVRPTLNELSVAADYRGEVLGAMNHFTSADRVMTASVPVRGGVTLYALVGDAFAWLAAGCFLSLLLLALLRPTRPDLLQYRHAGDAASRPFYDEYAWAYDLLTRRPSEEQLDFIAGAFAGRGVDATGRLVCVADKLT